jgi:hypothetical protein
MVIQIQIEIDNSLSKTYSKGERYFYQKGKCGEKGKYLLRQVIVIKCPLGIPNLGYSFI